MASRGTEKHWGQGDSVNKMDNQLGVDGVDYLRNILAVDEILNPYFAELNTENRAWSGHPEWFKREAFNEYQRWSSSRWYRTVTRGSGPHRLATTGLDVELDTSPTACAAACAGLGLRFALLAGDRVTVKRSAGRPLELAEEAVVLGAHQGRLYYRIVSQKNEGGSLTEGGGRAWFWDESEVVDDGLQLVGPGKGMGIELPLIDRFRCLSSGGLRIVYDGGAVMRSDLEIFDRSANIGTIPCGTVIPQNQVLERRVNSCGVVRFRVRYDTIGEGWISSRIRGGKEEAILEPVHSPGKETVKTKYPRFETPEESATAWYRMFKKVSTEHIDPQLRQWDINSFDEFNRLASRAKIDNSLVSSDSKIAALITAVADFTEGGDAVDCSFGEAASAVAYAVATAKGETIAESGNAVNSGANQAAAAVLATEEEVELPSAKALMARIAVLRALNRRARVALPWLMLRPSQEGTAILGGLCGHGASVERAGRNKLLDSTDMWVQVSSVASRIRDCRQLFFLSVKLSFLESVTNATTTPTPLSHDEYELPREIRTVRVNRLKARRAMAGDDNRTKRKHSVFAQLQNETRTWGGAALRRGFVAKGHGGQKRAFKVKLVGEGVNDYSGPYREVFTDAMNEIVQEDANGRGALGVLDPTPNNNSQIGDDQDLYMFSIGERESPEFGTDERRISSEENRIKQTFSSLTMPRDESSREVEESLVFLGRLVGTAFRHGIPVDLPLPMNVVWKSIVEDNDDDDAALKEMDLLERRRIVPNKASAETLLWQQRMLNSFVDGLSNVLPVEILSLLTGVELRDVLCGNADVDVDLLRRVVEYEGYQEEDPVVSYFWDSLREMTAKDRKKFLQFVWARSRLPNKESEFDAPFKIQRDSSRDDDADVALPSASTCFFTLTLPRYSSKDVLKEKLLFAIDNVCTMESDYVTNDAEVGEGWRGL
eukprot:CAMPEP_0116830474 /NCGR_PEP_ID=MMETSP0418-20121206/4782_1 /TAXON_ID=1158023 /ORGANISM="Astrosyne radiata, Strain 13vi08-1A" /LENGTH=941 /DNA_ID=CAMNT_0004459579 /DNA_START=23 /DNA_END=2849 /DNA_ORIENTATION=-